MQTTPISLRAASNRIPGSLIAPNSSECQEPKLPIKDGLNEAPSPGNALNRNVFSALGQRDVYSGDIALIKNYEKKLAELKELAEQSRSTKDLSQRSRSLQNTAKVYLDTIKALEALPDTDVSVIKKELSADLAKLLEEDLLLVYCIGYLAAEWFQDYAPYLENIINLKSLDAVTGQCLKQYYDIQSGGYQWCKAEKGSFEIKAEAMVQEQIHFLIGSLQGNRDKMASSLLLIENYLKNLIDEHPDRLGFHSIGDVYVFLMRQGSSSAIVGFLDTYKLIYDILKKKKLNPNFFLSEMHVLQSALSLCLGWRRFFSLNTTNILNIWELSPKYSMHSQPLTALYLENLELFQAACQDCYEAIEKEITKQGIQFLSEKSYMADLVSCLSIALLTVKNWTEDTFSKLGAINYRADIDSQEEARRLKGSMGDQSSALLESIAQIYLRSERLEHRQTAQTIGGFLRTHSA